MGVKKAEEKYRCTVCGKEIVVTKVGTGELVCCGKSLKKSEGKNKNRLKILFVDDEPDLLKLAGIRIGGWGHNLITAASGESAISAVINKKPDVIVLDYILPDMDGISILQKIRKIDEKVIVIMLTGHPSKDVSTWANKLKVRAFITKGTRDPGVFTSLKEIIDTIAE